MASEVKTNKVSPATGTTLSVGDSGDTLALATDAVTGFQVGSDAAGDVLYHDGTDYTRLAKPGTPADEVLTFATSATAPSWVAPAAGGSTLLLNADVSSPVASYTISSTYVNSTYDEYFMYFDALPATDDARLYIKAVVGGSVVTGTYLSWETNRVGGDYIAGNNETTTTIMGNPTTAGMGNVSGEGITGYFHLQNVNSTTRPAGINGMVYWTYISNAPNGSIFSGMFQSTQASQVMNGLHFVFNSGNITTANFKLYGMTK